MDLNKVEKEKLKAFINASLAEDIGEGDHTSLACVDPESMVTAQLLVKDVGVIAGVDFAKYVFSTVDSESKFDRLIPDGEDVTVGDVVFIVTCNAQALLKAERLVLNTMQRMSGTATLSSRFAFEVEGMPVKILDTRKTAPLNRLVQKWAVRIGGCTNYRDGLYDWIMIKDNHVDACGSIKNAIEKVNKYLKEHNLNLGITIEVRNLVELYQVLEVGGVTRIMFDNFEIPILREAVATVNHRFETEASGGVSLHSVRKIAKTGVDFISSGALTHSAGSLDLSLKVIK